GVRSAAAHLARGCRTHRPRSSSAARSRIDPLRPTVKRAPPGKAHPRSVPPGPLRQSTRTSCVLLPAKVLDDDDDAGGTIAPRFPQRTPITAPDAVVLGATGVVAETVVHAAERTGTKTAAI